MSSDYNEKNDLCLSQKENINELNNKLILLESYATEKLMSEGQIKSNENKLSS